MPLFFKIISNLVSVFMYI